MSAVFVPVLKPGDRKDKCVPIDGLFRLVIQKFAAAMITPATPTRPETIDIVSPVESGITSEKSSDWNQN